MSEEKEKDTESSSNLKKYNYIKSKSKLLIISSLILFFTIVFVYVFFIRPNMNTKDVQISDYEAINVACTDEYEILLAEATGYIDSNNYEALYKITDKIKLLNHYEKDQNCLAVLVFDSLSRNDYQQAFSLVEMIEIVYSTEADKDAGYLFTSNPEKLNSIVSRIRDNIVRNEENLTKILVE